MIQLYPGHLRRFLRDLKWRYRKNSHSSVFFYTFHKCASSLFSGYVLRNFDGLRLVNYAGQIYTGESVPQIVFDKTGYVYGPIRLSADPLSPVFTRLVEPASEAEFVKDKTAIFLLRDPRDILVSAYYSFGGSHGTSKVDEIREQQDAQKAIIQSMTIDQYAIHTTPAILANFETLIRLCESCQRSVILRYEDMINDWDKFVADLTRFVRIRPPALQQIYDRSRPRTQEDTTSHRRSGKTGGFRNKLTEQTIEWLNDRLGDVLDRFGYQR